MKVKSIMPVLIGTEWRVRVRYFTDPAADAVAGGWQTQIRGIGAGYTLHQAQTYCDSLRRDIARHGIDTVLFDEARS